MAPQIAPSGGIPADLVHRLEQLEERVRQLELDRDHAPFLSSSTAEVHVPHLAEDLHLPESTAGLVPLFGRALLALAGAYLLRALATSTLAPHWIGISLAVAYPVFWMILASRYKQASPITGTVYMAISVLAFAPMLWETTANLHILPTAAAAMMMAGYGWLGLYLAWRERFEAIAWLAALSTALATLALCFGTFDLAPFVVALLAIAVPLEVAAVQGLWLGPRRLVAFTADLTILWLIEIYGRGASLPEGYHAIPAWLGWGAPAALVVIFMAGIATRTLRRHFDVTIFETVELLAAFGLFVFAATRTPGALLVPGLILIVCGAVCYILAFKRLVRESHQINLYAYSAFGFGLILLGTEFALPSEAAPVLWAAASLVLLWVGAKAADFHALAFAAAAGFASGLASESYSTLLLRDGTHVALTIGTAAAFLAVAAASIKLRGLSRSIAATIFAWVATAWIASLLLQLLPASADAAWRAALRTALIVATAVAIAWVGRNRNIGELYWLIPGAMAVALGRLVVDDVPVGRPETIFISLLFYGGALLVLSKLMRNWRHSGEDDIAGSDSPHAAIASKQ